MDRLAKARERWNPKGKNVTNVMSAGEAWFGECASESFELPWEERHKDAVCLMPRRKLRRVEVLVMISAGLAGGMVWLGLLWLGKRG